jgi:hypothetical protein
LAAWVASFEAPRDALASTVLPPSLFNKVYDLVEKAEAEAEAEAAKKKQQPKAPRAAAAGQRRRR